MMRRRADLRQNGGDDVEQTDVKQEIDQQAVLHTVHLVPGKSNGRGAVAGPDIAVAINRFLTIHKFNQNGLDFQESGGTVLTRFPTVLTGKMTLGRKFVDEDVFAHKMRHRKRKNCAVL